MKYALIRMHKTSSMSATVGSLSQGLRLNGVYQVYVALQLSPVYICILSRILMFVPAGRRGTCQKLYTTSKSVTSESLAPKSRGSTLRSCTTSDIDRKSTRLNSSHRCIS